MKKQHVAGEVTAPYLFVLYCVLFYMPSYTTSLIQHMMEKDIAVENIFFCLGHTEKKTHAVYGCHIRDLYD